MDKMHNNDIGAHLTKTAYDLLPSSSLSSSCYFRYCCLRCLEIYNYKFHRSVMPFIPYIFFNSSYGK